MEIMRAIFEDPILIAIRIASSCYKATLLCRPSIRVGKGIVFKGIPHLETIRGGRIIIGHHVTLYSTSRQYFAHMSSPARLFAEEGGKIEIGDYTRINGATIHAREKIIIGRNCLIAANTSIIDSNGHELNMNKPESRLSSIDRPKPIYIGDSVWIGLNCVVLKGTSIGNGSVIAAGSVVNRDIPPGCIASGNPIRIINKSDN